MMRFAWRSHGLALLVAVALASFASCGTAGSTGGTDGGGSGGNAGRPEGGISDAAPEAPAAACTYPPGAPLPADGGAFHGVCPDAGCPAGTICVRELGSAGPPLGPAEYCAPIPDE